MPPSVRPKIFNSDPDEGGLSEAFGVIAQMIGIADVIAWLGMTAMSLFTPDADLALKGFGIRLVWLIAALFLLTGMPTLLLAYLGKAPRLSLILGCAFPLLFIAMYVGLTIAFA